jgi:hypothetical protein
MPDDPNLKNLWDKGQLAKISAWVNSKWRQGVTCSQCGASQWSIGTSPGHLLLGTSDGSTIVAGASYPVIVVLCGNCGHMVLVNALTAGVSEPLQPVTEVANG